MSKELIDAGINEDEAANAARLDAMGKLAAEAGFQVGGNAGIPALLPDGSLAEPDAEDAPTPEAPPLKT